MSFRDRFSAFGLFIGFFVLYVCTSAPGLAPYRDSGEMVILLKTLGVAHPPGYPLFTVLGRLSELFPWGTAAGKATMFSSLMAALSLMLLFICLRTWVSSIAAAFSILLLGLSHPFWDLATVPEMYSMGVLGWALAFYGGFVCKRPVFTFFILGLFLGVRMDMLLLIPIFFFFSDNKFSPKMTLLKACSFALGISIFLYLMIRSLQNPWLDWGNPDTLPSLLASLSRKSYSGTLDLLSLSYHTGENFGSTCRFYGEVLFRSLAFWGIIPIVFGLSKSFYSHKKIFWFLLSSFFVCGPFFFFLANMPPNPHSLAIIEASFILPTTLLILFSAFGFELLIQRPKMKAAFALMMAAPLLVGFQRSNKRDNFILQDSIINLQRSTPENSVLVMHKDVQFFSFWSSQLVDHKRPDISLVSTGLSGSPWYWDMKERWPTRKSAEANLKTAEGWPQMLSLVAPNPLMFGFDTDLPQQMPLALLAHGYLIQASSVPSIETSGLVLLHECMLDRAQKKYGQTPDFFSTDLIGDAARAYQFQGHQLLLRSQFDEALWCLKKSESLNPTVPQAYSDELYIWFAQNQFSKVVELGNRALQVHQQYLDASNAYRALPDVVNNIKADFANATVIVGAAAEKINRKIEARQYYRQALMIQDNAQAHYNLAVTYWNEDWSQVAQHMERAAALNPQMAGVQQYLSTARQHLQSK